MKAKYFNETLKIYVYTNLKNNIVNVDICFIYLNNFSL